MEIHQRSLGLKWILKVSMCQSLSFSPLVCWAVIHWLPPQWERFWSDTPLDRVSGLRLLTSGQLESTAHGNLAKSRFCLMGACFQNNTRKEATQLWENVQRNRLRISHWFTHFHLLTHPDRWAKEGPMISFPVEADKRNPYIEDAVSSFSNTFQFHLLWCFF